VAGHPKDECYQTYSSLLKHFNPAEFLLLNDVPSKSISLAKYQQHVTTQLFYKDSKSMIWLQP